jgi:hypothetical protein
MDVRGLFHSRPGASTVAQAPMIDLDSESDEEQTSLPADADSLDVSGTVLVQSDTPPAPIDDEEPVTPVQSRIPVPDPTKVFAAGCAPLGTYVELLSGSL